MENFAPEPMTSNEEGNSFVLTVELRNETTGEVEGYYRLDNSTFMGDEADDRQDWSEVCLSSCSNYLRPMLRRMQPGEFVPGTNVPGGLM